MSAAMEANRVLGLDETVEMMVHELVSVQRIASDAVINMPLLYPSGASVTVRVTPAGDVYHISDGGFAYREVEAVGADRSFAQVASAIVTLNELKRNSRAIFTDADRPTLFRAICDVAAASWQVVDRIYSRLPDETDEEIEEYLRERLAHIFGAQKVQPAKLIGASTSEWDVTAVVKQDGESTVFQAVAAHPNSIFRTSTAFHDLAALDHAPKLVAVVKDRKALGSRLGLLSPGRIIEGTQSDAVYLRAAA
jgi:hypothetical protein